MNYQKINNLFKMSQKFIKDNTGLNLKLSEQIELRNIIKSNSELKTDGGADIDCALSFLNINYGFGVYCLEDFSKYRKNRINFKKKFGFDYYAFYFQKIQDERFPL